MRFDPNINEAPLLARKPAHKCDVKAGDKVRVYRAQPDNSYACKIHNGVVVYAHPRGQYAVVQLDNGLRESYWGEELM